ncbi:DUF5690 family protein [Deminuibacter soli]|uniref:MFS transporter n=1 Tax=Deminuibacter soli TaxID=2291815 RepID=A0A3E1NDW4_9BACT|nr:DUF5690 family protein [Deminuibacter soli]RFM26031.1 hypothetical protein DXN05_22165 [Deminuibacter soli]
MIISRKLQQQLTTAPAWLVSTFAAVCSFGVYCCMYAFRKPFTAAGYNTEQFLHIDYKIWLVTAQVIGYMLSKFYGIRFISSMKGDKRAPSIILLITWSWLALLLFAITPAPYNIVFLLLNGFPLGMVWGLVFSFLEGRRATEYMGAVLSVSFIFSSGIVKTVGKYILLNWHVSEWWMPFYTGALFFVPMLLFTWLLNHMPAPTAADVSARSERKPMTKTERSAFLQTYLPGLTVIITTYVLLTVLRDFRDNFANELWNELGYGNQPSIFAATEVPISIVVLLCMSFLIMVKSNIKAFIINHYIIMGGYVLALVSTLLFSHQQVNGAVWIMLVGAGLYLSYVPFNCLYFERMIASYRIKGNVGFVMYVADSFGYLGSVAVLFIKQFTGLHVSWTTFFTNAVIVISILGVAGTIAAMLYFRKKYHSSQIQMGTSYA